MKKQLRVTVGQCSNKGNKPINQDFTGACIPQEPLLSSKGVALAIADGISSSDVSQIASEMSVGGFLQDYFSTSEAWSVKKSAQCVIQATNSWLYSQTRSSRHRFNMDKGYVCAFSALVFKSNTAHLFHAGDTRIFRISGNSLEQLTEDHRSYVDSETSYLNRAMGMLSDVAVDYHSETLDRGDIYILASDGVYEYLLPEALVSTVTSNEQDFNAAARSIVEQALAAGSNDNLSVIIARIDELPDQSIEELSGQADALPFPPVLQARMCFEGYTIERPLYVSSRSHVFLAVDKDSGERVVIKTPSAEMRGDAHYLERFLMEEWISKRVQSIHVGASITPARSRRYTYLVSEYIEGQSLEQWIKDNPKPSLNTVREIISQIAKGLQAFHRQEMVHQDLRPANIMIDKYGTVKIIDFGATKVAGIIEIKSETGIRGTEQYSAPEYFLGDDGLPRSDVFSLGVIFYQMLSGQLPFGAQLSRARTRAAQLKLRYTSLREQRPDLPLWIDVPVKKALHILPHKRYQVASEFIYHLYHPEKTAHLSAPTPLIARNPVAFWQGLSVLLSVIILGLLVTRP